jgi:hypothetical protein
MQNIFLSTPLHFTTEVEKILFSFRSRHKIIQISQSIGDLFYKLLIYNGIGFC